MCDWCVAVAQAAWPCLCLPGVWRLVVVLVVLADACLAMHEGLGPCCLVLFRLSVLIYPWGAGLA